MSNFKDFLFDFESSLETIKTEPKKKKTKKKKGLKQKDNMTEETGKEKRRMRKKSSHFKPPVASKEEKKKKKKKKKVELDAGLSLRPNETIKPEKLGRKKKVLFDLSPGCVHTKRPKFSSSSLRGAETREGAGTLEGAGTPEGAGRAVENDSQGSYVHSQDLFITQKTFRASPPLAASQTWMFPEESRLGPNRRTSPEAKGQRSGDRRSLKTRCRQNRKTPSLSVNPFLDQPVVVESSRRDSSTQTENFFTSELFVHRAPTASGEELQPLDLSLPHRVRGHRGGPCKAEEEVLRSIEAVPGKRGGGGGDSTPSPRSESDNKSGEATTSSEDGEVYGRIGIVTQVRTVQMRLNESFFFKTKGDGHSPRPASPLMKLAQGRDVKRRKSR